MKEYPHLWHKIPAIRVILIACCLIEVLRPKLALPALARQVAIPPLTSVRKCLTSGHVDIPLFITEQHGIGCRGECRAA